MSIFFYVLHFSTFSVDFREKVLLTGRVVYFVSMPKIQKYDIVIIENVELCQFWWKLFFRAKKDSFIDPMTAGS